MRSVAWCAVGLAVSVAIPMTPATPVGPGRTLSKAGPRPSAGLGHVVRHGDTAWTIARRYGVSLEALLRANRLRPEERLRVGRRLAIPGIPASPTSQEPPSLAAIDLGRPPTLGDVSFTWPVAAPLGSAFGPRGRGWHGGIDILAERGTPIRAAAPGIVVTSGWEQAYGRVVKIWHGSELMTVYAHNHENHVRVGDRVAGGQVIGTVGATGRATAPHLHFEIRLAGRKYDPRHWLPASRPLEVAAGPHTRPSVP
ncbi:MAG: peptidoglycan DD-metalloendopeptidase family protein [Candidatus Rokuibacteriota bacterium]